MNRRGFLARVGTAIAVISGVASVDAKKPQAKSTKSANANTLRVKCWTCPGSPQWIPSYVF